jgi:excisionase family DNA binding protein
MTQDTLVVTPPEAARLLGLGRTTVYKLIRSGDLKAIRVGRSVRVPREAIPEFIERKLAERREEGAAL